MAWSAVEIAQLRNAFSEAPRHGLNAEAYLSQLENGSDEEVTRAALAYAQALATGLVDPRELHPIFTLKKNAVDARSGLSRARASGRLEEWLRSLPPQTADYRALSAAYLQHLAEAAMTPPTDIPSGPLIRPGDADERLSAIAQRLRDRGFLGAKTSFVVYNATLEAAVRRLQQQAGLLVDGVLGPETLVELNLGPRDRARQLAVNLERRRWLARRPPTVRIDVNLPAAQLRYRRDGRLIETARVVAGSPRHPTPQLEETFDQLVVNPPWYVPQSIAEREILPQGSAYLARHDMYLRDGRVIQRPGPGAALGAVKFDMKNPYAIYLHDTPAKALFEAAFRFRSHGCVRVENAVAFARTLAAERGRAEVFDHALASGDTQVVELGAPIAVRLLYHTAFVDADGTVSFRPDVYGWDERVADALGLGPGRVRALLPPPPEVLGP